jgi:DNA invertase Pin-like site-specific DNA recombinase
MKNAILMCRVSSDEQAKGYSLDIQKEQLERYCLNNNITIVSCFKEDHSAKNFNRPEFEKFLKSMQRNNGKVDTLLVTSWDRFSRNLTDSLIMIRRLKKLGIEVHAIEQPIDLSIPESKAMLALYLAIPEIDNDRRSLKITGGIRAAKKAGRWPGKAPFGYRNSRDDNNRSKCGIYQKSIQGVQ